MSNKKQIKLVAVNHGRMNATHSSLQQVPKEPILIGLEEACIKEANQRITSMIDTSNNTLSIIEYKHNTNK